MADKPNDTKKKVEEHDETASDSDASLPDIECETCGVGFTSVKNYGAHMQSKKHQRKLAEAKFRAKNLESGSNHKKKGASENEDDDAEEDESEQMHCEVCDKYFSGYISYASHMKGSSHAKNLKKERLKKQMKDLPEVIHHGSDSEEEEDDLADFLPKKPYAKCSACQKQFSGPESLKMHMKSAAHHKKVKQSGALQKLKSELDPDGEGEEFYKRCDTCQKSFSGLVPYKTHMLSNVHKRNLERKKVAEEVKEFFCDGENGYACKECKKSFSDPLAFKSHLENNSHEKLKAKEALVVFLNTHPEIKFVTPFDRKEEEGGGDASDSEEDGSDSKYYLICTLCHVSFSGPESAQDHVRSKKHESAKKERKMLKLLKEKKKNSAKTEVENSKSKENNSASANGDSAESKSKNDRVYSVEDFEMI